MITSRKVWIKHCLSYSFTKTVYQLSLGIYNKTTISEIQADTGILKPKLYMKLLL